MSLKNYSEIYINIKLWILIYDKKVKTYFNYLMKKIYLINKQMKLYI